MGDILIYEFLPKPQSWIMVAHPMENFEAA
jgi:hypothetical protein